MADALARVEAGEEDPDCKQCGGILKSVTVMFGRPNSAAIAAASRRSMTVRAA